MRPFAHRAALSTLLVLACTTTAVQAQTTYDFSVATVATGPAGSIGTNVWVNTPDPAGVLMMSITKSQQGQGCEYTGCADAIGGDIHATSDGSLYFGLNSTPVGDVKAVIATSSHTSAEVNHKAFISGMVSGQGLYTSLLDPANTSFAFTFSGHSAAAGQGVQISLDLTSPDAPYTHLFSQTVTGNDAGDWQLVINTPVGMNLMGEGLIFSIGAASGANTLSSLVITPQLVAVPEPAAWSLMGLGLIGLTWMRRQRQS